MRAGRIEQFGTRPFLADMPEPTIAEGESLVQVQAASVGHLDVTIASGRFGVSPALPYTPGVEGAGMVVAGAAHEPGTRVAIRGGGVGIQRDGTWAELVAVPDRALRSVPDGMPLDVAACFYVPLATAYLALYDVGEFTAPEGVLVTGASGTVGRVAVDLALDAGAERVVAVVGRPSHAAIGRNDPRLTVVCADGAELVDALTDAPALAIDTVGGSTLEAILAAMPAADASRASVTRAGPTSRCTCPRSSSTTFDSCP